jgi:hypothetical protein|tara:strand:- start:148 stop:423 length:276 start_codon:yes stop_codon:yes gene_type:complete
MTPKYHLKDVIVLKQIMETQHSGKKNKDRFLCLFLELEKSHKPILMYEDDDESGAIDGKHRARHNLKGSGSQDGYYFEYVTIAREDVVKIF